MERIKLLLIVLFLIIILLLIGCNKSKLTYNLAPNVWRDAKPYPDYPIMPKAEESEDEYWMWPVN